jgi:hypothetical protein
MGAAPVAHPGPARELEGHPLEVAPPGLFGDPEALEVVDHRVFREDREGLEDPLEAWDPLEGQGGVAGGQRAPGRVEARVPKGHPPSREALVEEGRTDADHHRIDPLIEINAGEDLEEIAVAEPLASTLDDGSQPGCAGLEEALEGIGGLEGLEEVGWSGGRVRTRQQRAKGLKAGPAEVVVGDVGLDADPEPLDVVEGLALLGVAVVAEHPQLVEGPLLGGAELDGAAVDDLVAPSGRDLAGGLDADRNVAADPHEGVAPGGADGEGLGVALDGPTESLDRRANPKGILEDPPGEGPLGLKPGDPSAGVGGPGAEAGVDDAPERRPAILGDPQGGEEGLLIGVAADPSAGVLVDDVADAVECGPEDRAPKDPVDEVGEGRVDADPVELSEEPGLGAFEEPGPGGLGEA